MPQLQFYLFGTPRVEIEGQLLSISRRKTVALIAYMVVNAQPHNRDMLATLLWPEHDQSGARANLRRDLSRVRKALGDEALLIDRSQAGMHPSADYWVDVVSFQAQLDYLRDHDHFPRQPCADCLAACERAVELYTADFMAGFTLPDCPEFDNWQFFQAENLRRNLAEILQTLVQWHLSQSEFERAIASGRRWLALDNLNEPAHRQLMRLYAWAGQQAAALHQYEECVRLLDTELAIPPEPETTELYEAIRTRQLPPPDIQTTGAASRAPVSQVAPAERYEIKELLASGGHGEVYLGHDRVGDTPVVIKRLKSDLITDEVEYLARFRREGEVLSQLNHPNIVRMLAMFTRENQRHIAMEYVPGGDLCQLLDTESRLPLDRALDVALELADALSRAHHLGIIHRDVKPANILLAEDGTPRLTDFGVARLERSDAGLTRTGDLLGSPAYMSPEALLAQQIDPRSDIWSLGAVLHEMLAGEPPFGRGKVTALMIRILNDPVPDLSELRPDVPPVLAQLVKRMLAKEPEARLSTMRQVAAALEAIRDGRTENLIFEPLWESQEDPSSITKTAEPAAKPQDEPPHNLPPQLTPFFGREEELAQVEKLLVKDPFCRLMTLVGPGGIGKSRLAIEAGARLLPRYPDGVYFVSLVGVTDADYIVPTIAKALDFQFSGAGTPRVQLLNFLRSKTLLLIIDNFEHLLQGADLTADILRFAPDVKVLVTSRTRLGLQEEWGYELGGLPVPDDSDKTLGPAEVESYDAVRLFSQRARRAYAAFRITEEDVPAIVEICRLLDGMPLGLELAAPWVRAIPVREIAAEIKRNLDFLSTPATSVVERHRSLRAIFSQTWDTLSAGEKRVLRRLSVFQGSFTRAAAEAIAGATLAELASLLDRALLRRESDGRYSLHELIRQFAAERLEAAADDEEDVTRDKHSHYYLQQLVQHRAAIKGGQQRAALAEIAADSDNVRAAWQRGVDRRQIAALSEAAESYWLYSEFRGVLNEGEETFRQAVAALSTPPPTKDEEKVLLGFLQAGQGSLAARRGWLVEGIEQMKNGLTMQRQVHPPDRQKEAFTLAWMAFVLVMQGKYDEAADYAQESLDLFPQTNDYWTKAGCLRLMGASALYRGQLDPAEELLIDCLDSCAQIGERRIQTYAKINLGQIAMFRGEYGRAAQWLDEAEQLSGQLNDRLSRSDLLHDLGLLAIVQGQYDRARDALEESLALSEEIGSSNIGTTKFYLGILWQHQDEPEKAYRFFRDGLAAAKSVGHQTEAGRCLLQMGILARMRGNESQAAQLLNESLEIWREMSHEPMMASVWVHLGQLMTDAGETRAGEARLYYANALQLALKHGLAPVALEVMTGVATLLLRSGEAQRAAELLVLAEKHPAGSYVTREAAGQRLQKVPDDLVTAERNRGQLRDWRETAERLIAGLDSAGWGQKPVSTNLPSPATPFVGRKRELAEVKQLLVDGSDNRMVTVTGPGGMGKTRLALAAAEALAGNFPDGVVFLALAPLDSADQILPELAEQLEFRFRDRADPEAQLLDHLRDKRMLLVMDNFEHLLGGTAVVDKLLQSARHIKILATSRERLSLTGEAIYPLSGLSIRQASFDKSLLTSEAASLFIQRAGLSADELDQNPEYSQAIARLCRLVEGMPLAIVLAAGWLDVLTLPEIAEEIARSFDLLESDLRDLPERQRSIRAVFTTSWSQLTESDQTTLAKLSLFRSGFTRTAAQMVAGASVRTLLTLVNKSWLQRDATGRFYMHELARQYAQEKLEATPEGIEEAREQYIQYFIELFRDQNEAMNGPRQKEAVQIVATEFDNARVAWDWLLAEEQVSVAFDTLLPALFRYCEAQLKALDLNALLATAQKAMAGRDLSDPENRRLQAILLTTQTAFCLNGYPIRFETFGLLIPVDEELIRRAWKLVDSMEMLEAMHFWGIVLTYVYGRIIDRVEGRAKMRQLIALYRAANQRRQLALGLLFLVHLLQLDYADKDRQEEIESHIQETLAIYQSYGDERESGHTLRALGQLRRFQHDFEEAIRYWQVAQAKFQTAGDTVLAADLHWQIGDAYLQIGEFDEAFRSYRKTSDAYLAMGITRLAAQVLSKESYEAVRYSSFEHALQTRKRSLEISEAWGDTWALAWSHWEMGELYRVMGELETAQQWYEKARPLFDQVNDTGGYIFYHRGLGDLAHMQGDFEEAERQLTRSLEYAREPDHDWGIAYARAGLARATLALGQVEKSRQHLIRAFSRSLESNEQGLILVVLTGTANWFAATGSPEQAVMLAKLVVQHHASWRETKTRAEAVMVVKESLSPEQIASAEAEAQMRKEDVWQLAAELLTRLEQMSPE